MNILLIGIFCLIEHSQGVSQIITVSDSILISQPVYEITIEKNVAIPMSDGVVLRADLYRPDVPGKFPVLIGRVGYTLDWDIHKVPGEYYARRGYAVLWQNVRGTFNSEGTYEPFADDGWGEHKDGYETIEWAAEQEWSNGRVGMLGVSYSGLTQYLVAPTHPPHLKALFIQMGWGSTYNLLHENGAFLQFNIGWFPLGMTIQQHEGDTLNPCMTEKITALKKARSDEASWSKHLPLKEIPPLEGMADWYVEWMKHPSDGPFWSKSDITEKYSEVDVPIYHWNGWFDIRLAPVLNAFIGISKNGKSEFARSNQRLIIGPWSHFSRPPVGSDFGPDDEIDELQFRLIWYDYWLKGIENGILDEKAVKLFLMGDNRWVGFNSWPPEKVRYLPIYFREGNGTNHGSLNNGRLTFQPPEESEQADIYNYDPENPVFKFRHMGNCGPKDYAELEGRMLTYTTDTIKKDMAIVGPLKAILYAKSSTRDTDWIVRLCDVQPDGRSMSVCQGVIRARYRNSLENEELLEPDQVYKYEISITPTAQVFKTGHMLRIQVTSSDFRWYDRNLNTGGLFAEESKGVVAVNTVLHDKAHPSHVILPVLEKY